MKTKIYTLIFLLITFTLIWENVKKVKHGLEHLTQNIEMVPANQWLKEEFQITIREAEEGLISYASHKISSLKEAINQ